MPPNATTLTVEYSGSVPHIAVAGALAPNVTPVSTGGSVKLVPASGPATKIDRVTVFAMFVT